MDGVYKGFNFSKLREEKKLTLTQAAEQLGVDESKVQAFEEGYNNPTRGALFNGIADLYEIDPIRLKAFIMWRKDKWAAWEEDGMPENDPKHTWDDVEDYKGENLEELGFFSTADDDSEELPEMQKEELKDSLAKEDKNPFDL